MYETPLTYNEYTAYASLTFVFFLPLSCNQLCEFQQQVTPFCTLSQLNHRVLYVLTVECLFMFLKQETLVFLCKVYLFNSGFVVDQRTVTAQRGYRT